MKLDVIIKLITSSGDEFSYPAEFLASSSKSGDTISYFSTSHDGLIAAHKGSGAILYDMRRPIGDDVTAWKDDDGEKVVPPKLRISCLSDRFQEATSKCWGVSFDRWEVVADTHDAAAVRTFLTSLSTQATDTISVPDWARR